MSVQVDIKKHFPTFDLEVAFSAEDEVFGLLGASGCGKSLTLRCIAGIETPDEGHIEVNGTTFFDSAGHVNLKPQVRKTALLFQNYMLFPNLTVAQNVAAGIPRTLSREERDARVRDELRRFDLSAFEARYPAQLSGGQQQRVALARMLAARPGILMLDEPFSALDAHLKGVLEQSLGSLFDAFAGTIIYVSHDIDEAVGFCDRIAVVERGHIQEIDAARELINHPKSVAGLKISGVKNVSEVERVDAMHVRAQNWGITLALDQATSSEVKAVGVRAARLEVADEPGTNVFRARVDRTTDSRFERMCLLGFCEREAWADDAVNVTDQEMRFLHQHVYWRVRLEEGAHVPEVGDELLIRIPERFIYAVNR